MENSITLKNVYITLLQIPAITFKRCYLNKEDLAIENGINKITGASIIYYIPYKHLKTKIAAQRYILDLINEAIKVENRTAEQQILDALAALDVKIETIKQLIDAQITIAKNILND